MKNNNGKKILYILVEKKVKPARFIEIYRRNYTERMKKIILILITVITVTKKWLISF